MIKLIQLLFQGWLSLTQVSEITQHPSHKTSLLSLTGKKTALIEFQRADEPRWVHSTVQFVTKETTSLLQRRTEHNQRQMRDWGRDGFHLASHMSSERPNRVENWRGRDMTAAVILNPKRKRMQSEQSFRFMYFYSFPYFLLFRCEAFVLYFFLSSFVLVKRW